MPRLDHMPEQSSPVSVSQAGLIRLSGPARAVALDVLRVNSLQTGAYVSRFRGRGMEFAGVREYIQGDDVRTIDWNVSARMTDPYIKVFTEEREMTVMLVVDVSESGLFGTGAMNKRRLATEVAAVAAFSAMLRARYENQ